MSLLLQGAVTAASVGMGCGACCGSGMGVFLSGYLMTHAKDAKQSCKGVAAFYLGKIMSVVLLCAAASLLGGAVMDENGAVGGVPVRAVVDTAMIGMGIALLVRWARERRGICGCRSHGGDVPEIARQGSVSLVAVWAMGVGYGVSPCAPLLMVMGYAATLPTVYAAAVGGLFALSSAVSPTLFLLLISGSFAGRMRKDLPRTIVWFRLACYILLIGLFAADLIKLVVS